ncbi:hypothetical protein V6R86_08435 [Sphingomonas kaistensis]|uniref:Uncharacterized protein n=1 Tax=Sphingomonas kaistensis TaxID=298708 RepID=A0ABZ2G3Y1_9SPHN
MTAPFGIEFYSAVADLQILTDLGQGKFFVSAPKPHPSFEQYVVQATPGLGVVWIKAVSPVLNNDAYGTRVRQQHGDLRGQLEKRYGPGKTTDFLVAGSIWDEDRDWTQGLSANERHYFTIWERPYAQLPEDLTNVFLGANGFGGDETSFSIEYSSAKLGVAEEEIRDMLSDLL